MLSLHDRNIRGNALFLILIAIFLLGGLTVMMTRTGGQTEETGQAERTSINVSSIFRYASALEGSVSRLLTQGCSENYLSFYYASEPYGTPNDYLNSGSVSSCEIFNATGGGIEYMPIPIEWREQTSNYNARSHFTGAFCVNGVGRSSGTSCSNTQTELLFAIIGLTKETCVAINSRLGITNPSGNPPVDEVGINPFTGSFTPSSTGISGVTGDDSTATAAPLKGKKAGCVQDAAGTTANQYLFYQTLQAR